MYSYYHHGIISVSDDFLIFDSISVRQCLSGSWTSCCEKSTGKLHSYSPVWGGRQRQKNSPPPQDCVWRWWRTRLLVAARLPKSPTPRLRAFTAEMCKRCVELFCVGDLSVSVGVFLYLGSGDRSVVRALDSWLKFMGLNPCRSGGRIFFSRVSFLCWLLFWYLFHLRVTAVAHKRSQSFCQMCRWQATAKHAYTIRMWLWMKWHGAWFYGGHRMCRDGSSFMWHQPCQCYKYITLVDIQKHALFFYKDCSLGSVKT